MKNPDIIFWLGVFLFIVGDATLFSMCNNINSEVLFYFFLINAIALVMVIVSWTMKKKEQEKYNERSMYISGQPIAGTVWASDPHNTPGLGWLP